MPLHVDTQQVNYHLVDARECEQTHFASIIKDVPNDQARTIRTIADLASLPETQLIDCLGALCSAIQANREKHLLAISAGEKPPGSPMDFDVYEWRPEQCRCSGHLLCELDLPERVRKALAANQFDGLAELMARVDLELMTGGLSDATRSVLLQLAGRGGPILSADATLPVPADDAGLDALMLSPKTKRVAAANGWQTLGDLREADFLKLCTVLGRKGMTEVFTVVRRTGRPFKKEPTQTQLWRAGLLSLDDMQIPQGDGIPLHELEPWLGRSVVTLIDGGIATLGDLKRAAREGRLQTCRGIGKQTEGGILLFLSRAS